MNLEILEKLMEENHIRSYLKLSQILDIPYTSLMDLIHGRGLKITNIKQIADFFKVTIDCLVSPITYYNIVLENNTIKSFILLNNSVEHSLYFLLNEVYE